MKTLKKSLVFSNHFAIFHRFTYDFVHFSPSASDLSHSFKVENIIVHPDYVPDHPSNQHDLAVIKIREEEINEKGEGEKDMKP